MNDLPDWSTSVAFSEDAIIFNTAGLGNPLAPGQSVSVSLAQYASLIVVANTAAVMALAFEFHQSNDVGGALDTTPYTEFLTCSDPAQTPTWAMPIYGGSVKVTNNGTANVNIICYGSNRAIPKANLLGSAFSPRSLSYNGPVTAGVPVPLVATDGGFDGTDLNGSLYIRAAASAIAGTVGYKYVRGNGSSRNIFVASVPANGSYFGVVTQPMSPTIWIFQPATTLATPTLCNLDITPFG